MKPAKPSSLEFFVFKLRYFITAQVRDIVQKTFYLHVHCNQPLPMYCGCFYRRVS